MAKVEGAILGVQLGESLLAAVDAETLAELVHGGGKAKVVVGGERGQGLLLVLLLGQQTRGDVGAVGGADVPGAGLVEGELGEVHLRVEGGILLGA